MPQLAGTSEHLVMFQTCPRVCVCSYVAVHSFGRRMLYPGSTSLIQALMGLSVCLSVCLKASAHCSCVVVLLQPHLIKHLVHGGNTRFPRVDS